MSPEELQQNQLQYLISRQWVVDAYNDFGFENQYFQSRVLGEFPSQSEDSLLSLTWLEQAKTRPIDKIQEAVRAGLLKVRAGIDVAGPGEAETVLVIKAGPAVLEQCAWPHADPRGEVVGKLMPYRGVLENVNVDSAGMGYYFARHLEDLGFPVTDVNVGEASSDSEKYVNLKAELYWALHMRAKAGDLAGIVDDTTIGQLAGIRWKQNARGQIEIESKDAARKRGVKSPDRAEAVMLAYGEHGLHGLIEFWGQEAQKAAAASADKSKPLADAGSLSDAQKKDAGWGDMFQTSGNEELQGKTGIGTLGKVVTTQQQPDVCPKCGNKFLAQYGEGAWRCNSCGASGRGK
jgi:ribosomal protein S27AE